MVFYLEFLQHVLRKYEKYILLCLGKIKQI